MNSFRRVGVVLVANLVLAGLARADINLPSVPPPQPEPYLAKVYIGETVDIPLVGVTRSGSGLQFIIRRPPTLGHLSEIRMTGPNSAVVTYTPESRVGAGVDRFRYAASSPGLGVSTPAEVTVSVQEKPEAFIAPARLDFPDIPVGRSAVEPLEIRNEGGGRIEGRLTLPAPWKVAEGDGSYSLGPGDSQTIEIRFSPTEARQFADTGEFSHAPGFELGLGGRGYLPFEIAPRVVHLESDGHNEARAGIFILRNVSAEDADLQISGPSELVVQSSIHLAAGAESEITVRTRPGFLGTLAGKLSVGGAGQSLDVPIQVASAPARLEVSPAAVNFGTVAVGRSDQEKIVLHNVGGSPAELHVKKPPGVEIDPDPTYEDLPAGASRQYEISYTRPLPGRLNDTVIIESGELGLRLPVSAVVKEEWRRSDQTAENSASESESPKNETISYNEIPPVDRLGVTLQTKTELDLAWKKAPNATRYVLYLRNIVFDDKGGAKFAYKRLDRVKVMLVRDQARATLVGLRPGEHITLVIVGFAADGSASRPSSAFVLATKPSPVIHLPWMWLVFLVLAGCVALIMRERRRERAASDAEVARIG